MSAPQRPALAYLDLQRAHAEIADELADAAARVVRRGWYVLGPEVTAFEAEFAAYSGTEHCVGVGSGLAALELVLRAWDVGPGDDVLVPSNTYIATWLAITAVGARPVPVEPDPVTALVTADGFAAALTPRTRVLLPVNLYGRAVDPAPLRALAASRGLRVLVDAAQSHGAVCGGAPAGAAFDAAAWSFYPSKNLGALGDAGAVTTGDVTLANRLRRLRNYGSTRKYAHDELGTNSRLDELQAALLRVQLPHLDGANARRRVIAQRYLDGLAGCPALRLPDVPPDPLTHVWHVFAVRHPQRDALARVLGESGVGTLSFYPEPPHRSGAYRADPVAGAHLPVADAWAASNLGLPVGPYLSDAEVAQVIEAVCRACATLGMREPLPA